MQIQKKQRLIIVIGVILALIAVSMTKVYLDQQRRIIEEQEKRRIAKMQGDLIPVLVTTRNVPKGVEIKSDSIEVKMMPSAQAKERAATSLSRVSDMVTTVSIPKGEQITLDKLQELPKAQKEVNREPVGGSLAARTPIGKRAITTSVDHIGSVGGMIRPGDYVDVLVVVTESVPTPGGKQASQITSSFPLFQNVLVLAVGRDLNPSEPEGAVIFREKGKTTQQASSSSIITLALSPQEANVLAFVQEQAKIRLTLRSPADAKTQPFQTANWPTFMQQLIPQEDMEQVKETPRVVEESFVEIYRGLSKEQILLTE
ncbi:MAG: Flp pilus assembly protein CpaB [Candidatus Omnitrophota bacterium]